ncbi:DUF4917 family protein [Acinetobacter shaoyimingii]|uniref:DUF4917 family protein n=1 Tax=Acinetobacter shaoyimingii TaxID=2715164 RepID=UPI001D0E8EF2|nr:DUF4917 family protein [Acinetobacter shaoyimingii]
MNKFDYQIKEWAEIQHKYKNGSLVIGNGSSIALYSEFDFRSLKEKAEKSKFFNNEISDLFNEFVTCDFELILRLVWHAKLVNKHLQIDDKKINSAYENIKEALIKVVREVHCENTEISKPQYKALYNFTKQFKTIVSLNYDLILYWILMYGNGIKKDAHIYKDCFNKGKFDFDWTRFRECIGTQKEITLVFYQHGNLSVFRDVGNTEHKLQRGDFKNLLDVITEEWKDDKIPLFVAEGTGNQKLESIKSSPYLSTIYYEVLPTLISDNSNLVIYGWGLGDQESHLVNQIFKNKNTSNIAISIYSKNQEECNRIYNLINKIAPHIEIEFFDSQSSGCWNNV